MSDDILEKMFFEIVNWETLVWDEMYGGFRLDDYEILYGNYESNNGCAEWTNPEYKNLVIFFTSRENANIANMKYKGMDWTIEMEKQETRYVSKDKDLIYIRNDEYEIFLIRKNVSLEDLRRKAEQEYLKKE